MGGGSWSESDYRAADKGTKAFAYDRDIKAKPRSEWEIHQSLNPKGLTVRESRDSAEHPQSNAVMVGLDVTGSMASVVVDIQSALGKLMDMLLKEGYISDPQLLFYAVGDATNDKIPFQISQFESDNRINDQLTKVILEGGGGGTQEESYELGFYTAARYTAIDCFERRGRKGYLFTIGDEEPYGNVKKSEVKEIFGTGPQDSVPLKDIALEAQKKFHTFHIIPRGSNNFGNRSIRNTWVKVLGGEQFVIELDRPEATAETIAVAIGLNEGAIEFEQGIAAVAKKSGQETASAVRKALTAFAQYAAGQPRNRTADKKAPAKAPKRDRSDEGPDDKDWKL